MNKTTKNIKPQTKNEYLSNIAKRLKVDYANFLKLPNKKDFLKVVDSINYKINEDNDTIKIVYINKDIMEDLKLFIKVELNEIGANKLKEIIIKSFMGAFNMQLNTVEKQKDFNTLTYSETLKAYQFYKTLNLQIYFNNKSIEYNKLTKQYQSKNI